MQEVRINKPVLRAQEPSERFYTPQQVAKLLNISITTVYRLSRSKEGPVPYVFGKSVIRFKPSDIFEWLETTKRRNGKLK